MPVYVCVDSEFVELLHACLLPGIEPHIRRFVLEGALAARRLSCPRICSARCSLARRSALTCKLTTANSAVDVLGGTWDSAMSAAQVFGELRGLNTIVFPFLPPLTRARLEIRPIPIRVVCSPVTFPMEA